jgi:AraC-like DNA-binding protein
MIRKIVVEIRIDQEPNNHFISRLHQLVSSVFHDYDKKCLSLTAFEGENKIFFRGGDEPVLDPDVHINYHGEFQIGSLSLNISSTENSANEFIDNCIKNILENIGSEKYNILTIAEKLNVSKPTFFRKIKQITGLSATAFIRRIKMQVAYQLLLTKKYTVSEVAWQCGYASARHFSKIFFSTFQQYPSKIF